MFPAYPLAEDSHVYTEQDLQKYGGESNPTNRPKNNKATMEEASALREEISAICDNNAVETRSMTYDRLKENQLRISTIESKVKHSQIKSYLKFRYLNDLKGCRAIYDAEIWSRGQEIK